MITYVDTSRLIKLLIDETGSDQARQIWDRADALITARLTDVEARATLAAATRAARPTVRQHHTAVAESKLVWSSLNVVEVTADVPRVRTGDSKVCGIPLPTDARPDPERSQSVVASSVGTIQEVAAFCRD